MRLRKKGPATIVMSSVRVITSTASTVMSTRSTMPITSTTVTKHLTTVSSQMGPLLKPSLWDKTLEKVRVDTQWHEFPMIAMIMAMKGLNTIAPLSEGRLVSRCYMNN